MGGSCPLQPEKSARAPRDVADGRAGPRHGRDDLRDSVRLHRRAEAHDAQRGQRAQLGREYRKKPSPISGLGLAMNSRRR